ncbi:pilus assembly protein PilP [Zobellella maritima]|uniref:pilus assembly protein PilP n=1 Tax=Zobellella maritima TaxID=2059725 RepID=UPI000E3022DC|nr:pilus assembly protein PilP [Zobellella maritima]
MKNLLLPVLLLLVSACSDEDSDLRVYVAEVKARPSNPPEPLPDTAEFVPEPYRSVSERSPFAQPQPEEMVEQVARNQTCDPLDTERKKELLEQYSLDNLSLRGTLGDGRSLWGLVRTQDGVTHQVGVGHHLGLYNGKVTDINNEELTLTEYIPDGKGCWQPRVTQLTLSKGG